VADTAPAGEVSVRAAITRALDEALGADDAMVLLGEDIADPGGGVFGVTKGLSTKYGADRVRDTPISEQAIVGAAVGAALGGLRPVAEIMFMDFLGLCLDQLANHAAKLRYMSGGRTPVPMVLRTAVGGGLQVGAQHSQMLEAWLTHVPGLKVVVPSTPSDARAPAARLHRRRRPLRLHRAGASAGPSRSTGRRPSRSRRGRHQTSR
jgi:pyruvate/2-oxoglutarate/acetoin dehydrogenase E1 component